MSIITALASLRALANNGTITLPMYWPDENNELPDTPAPFVYFAIDTQPAYLASFGSGRFGNTWRTPGELQAFVFVPVGEGIERSVTLAEQVASVFRSYRDSTVSCFAASVHPVGKGSEMIPDGLDSAAGNYACSVALVDLFFDQVG